MNNNKFMKNGCALIIGTILTAQIAGAVQNGHLGDQGDGPIKTRSGIQLSRTTT